MSIRHLILTVAGVAALSVAACTPAEDTKTEETMAPAAEGAMAPADGAMAPADGAMAAEGAMAPADGAMAADDKMAPAADKMAPGQ
jgi:hypothetical protein